MGAETMRRGVGDEEAAPKPRLAGGPLYRWPAVVVLIGVLVTVAFALVASTLNAGNERRLLKLRAKEVAAALTSSLPNIQTPLGSAAALADATNGNAARFSRLISPYVGIGRSFISVSLWRVGATAPSTTVGAPAALAGTTRAPAFIARAARSSGLTVISLVNRSNTRVGYAFSGSMSGPFVAYAEVAVPARRLTTVPAGSAYSDLDFAIYFGRVAAPSALLVRTVAKLPLPAPRATVSVPLGDQYLTVVVSRRRALGGSLPQSLPWAIAIVGALLTLAAAVLTARLVSDRRRALRLAEENRRLYGQQRSISETLQHALLPAALPQFETVELSARYDAGVKGLEIGGDWYDVVRLDQDRLLLVVGDVSGRGLRAAAAMASVRFAIHYAARDEPPEIFLPKISQAHELRHGNQLATVLCAEVNLRTRAVRLTSAGHLPLLVLGDGTSEFVEAEVGPPLGVDHDPHYPVSFYEAPAGATLLGFTDGLVERRGEVIDDGLDRLREAALRNDTGQDANLDELIAALVRDVRAADSADDTVIAGIRWRT